MGALRVSIMDEWISRSMVTLKCWSPHKGEEVTQARAVVWMTLEDATLMNLVKCRFWLRRFEGLRILTSSRHRGMSVFPVLRLYSEELALESFVSSGVSTCRRWSLRNSWGGLPTPHRST